MFGAIVLFDCFSPQTKHNGVGVITHIHVIEKQYLRDLNIIRTKRILQLAFNGVRLLSEAIFRATP